MCMALSQTNSTANNDISDKPIWYFLFFWTALNIIQACTLEIHADEAYYWLYSKFLDWGYFDHPPMVAVFIRIGDSIVHSEFGVRMMTVLASTVSLYLLWLIVKKYAVEAKWFILLVSGTFIFHIYGFMTTPDAPLFLFTVLFYYIYQRYIDDDKPKWVLLLALIIACLLYSKYHGVLLIAFTMLANVKLLQRPAFWAIVVISAMLYIPHILWQVNHGYPSITYHLFEQSTDHYDWAQTYTYFPGQLLLAGPLVGWFVFYNAFSTRIRDPFTRCLAVNCIGTFLFFFLSSIRGEVQPQWTLIGFAPLVMLALIRFKQTGPFKPWFSWLATANVVFIVVIRIAIIAGLPLIRQIGQIKSLYGFKLWAKTVHEKASNNFVVMDYGFQNPSKYCFYTNSTRGFDYDSKYYHISQFEIWPIEERMQHKKAYYLLQNPVKGVTTDTIKTEAGVWYGGWVNDVRTYQKVIIGVPADKLLLAPGQKTKLDLTITNPYPYAISFNNQNYTHKVVLGASMNIHDRWLDDQLADSTFNKITLKPREATHYTFILAAPQEKGDYNLMFSLRTTPFPGSKNSRVISLKVE